MRDKVNKNLQDGFMSFINEGIDVFEEDYQSKFIKVFVEDKKNWSQQIMDIISPEYFDGYHKILVDYQIDFFTKYRVPADYSELKEMANDKEKDELLKEHIYGLIDKIKEMNLEYQKKESVKERAYGYFKSSSVKNALIKCAIDWKKNTFDTLRSTIEKALSAGEVKDAGHNYVKDVKKRLKKDFRNPVPILPGLDEYIGGGVAGGELFVVMAPTGGGKSMFLVRNGVTALRNNKKVVYFTLELSEEAVGQRFDACLNELKLSKVTNFEELILQTAEELQINLQIKRYPDGFANVNTLRSYLDFLKCNENFIPDVIIVDYADNMKPMQKGEQLRHDLVEIYKELRSLAIECDIPCLTASQTSGDGYSKKDIELGMTAESKGKNNVADLVVGFGRDNDDVKDGKANLKILKNRNGPIGKSFILTFDSSILKIEIDEQVIFTKNDKKAIIGIDSTERKNKDAKNINNYMSSLSNVLNSQEFNNK